ncbi:MAG: hypothetical protein EAX96_02610 [Candidatus Lokiarchaeota archaeon]|nr:hypothetical protein [Candidatus Lokiarchaeota archaeon]
MEIKNYHLLYITGILLIGFGSYQFFTYLRPLNNIISNLLLSIPISFYDLYDILQFSFGIFYIFYGLFLLSNQYKKNSSRYVLIAFLITLIITSFDYIPIISQILLGSLSFSQTNYQLVTFYMIYLLTTILSKIMFQLFICLIIIKIIKNEEYYKNIGEFLYVFGLFYSIFYTNELLYLLIESIILANPFQIILNWYFLLYFSFGILFGVVTFILYGRRENKDEIILKYSYISAILFGFFLIFHIMTAFVLLSLVQVIFQVILQVLMFFFAIILFKIRTNSKK